MRFRARSLGAVCWTLWMYLGLRWGQRLVRAYPSDAPSNCLLWALQQQQAAGGALRLGHSHFGPWLHTQWIDPEGIAWEYNPPTKRRRRFPLLLFQGRAVRKA
jgi:hypothetical protein